MPDLQSPKKVLKSVLIFTETYAPEIGGGETQARLLAEGLAAKGCRVSILTRLSQAGLAKVEKQGTITVYRIGPAGSGQLKKWGLIFSGLPLLFRLRKQYDVIFTQGYRIVGITAVLLGKLFGKPIVLKADSQGEMSGDFFIAGLGKFGITRKFLPFKLFMLVRNSLLRRADAFVAIYSGIADEYRNSGVDPDRIRIIPNCVDTRRFLRPAPDQRIALRRSFGLPEQAKVAIYTGRLVSYKGLPLLLKVWKDLCEKHTGLVLLLVGTGGLDIHNCEAELKEFVRANRMEEAVRFTGSVTNVHAYLQASDLYVFPTENDAFPGAIIEAMVSGLPVIATPVGAIETIVTDRNDGLIIQPGDYHSLYEALETLIGDESLGSRLGNEAIRTVRENFSAESVTEKYVRLFQELLAAKAT